MARLVAVSGGFDPLHVGHLAQLQTAFALTEDDGCLIVFLNSDTWLRNKKGYVFMPWEERRQLLLGLRFVDTVIAVEDSDGTVASAIRQYRPNLFVKGGDRTVLPAQEAQACKDVSCQTVFGAGGMKLQSSSELIRKVIEGCNGGYDAESPTLG